MSEEVRQRIKAGEQLPVGSMKIPMVDLPLGATGVQTRLLLLLGVVPVPLLACWWRCCLCRRCC